MATLFSAFQHDRDTADDFYEHNSSHDFPTSGKIVGFRGVTSYESGGTGWNTSDQVFDMDNAWYDGMNIPTTVDVSNYVSIVEGQLLATFHVEQDDFPLMQFDQAPGGGGNGDVQIICTSGGNIDAHLFINGWNNVASVTVGSRPTEPFALMVRWKVNTTDGLIIEGKIWDLDTGSPPGSWASASGTYNVNFAEFEYLHVAGFQDSVRQVKIGKLVLSDSFDEDLSGAAAALTYTDWTGGGGGLVIPVAINNMRNQGVL